MCKNHISIMIISTIPDMFSEHYYFIKEVFPQLKEICNSHDIDLEYVDLYFSMTQKEFDTCRSIQKYFNSMDSDRTFYICFRGQKLGCVPTPADIDKLTLQEYPYLVDYIGDEDEVLRNAKLIIISEGMTETRQIGCIEG